MSPQPQRIHTGEETTISFGPFYAIRRKGGWWFRLFGYGIAWHDCKREGYWEPFSVREGLRRRFYLRDNKRTFEWAVEFLRRRK